MQCSGLGVSRRTVSQVTDDAFAAVMMEGMNATVTRTSRMDVGLNMGYFERREVERSG